MPKDEKAIRKSIRDYAEPLPEPERNPYAKEDVDMLIERAAQPLPSKPETPPQSDGYSDKRTHSQTAEATSD